jgi:hypothetical protein
MTARGSLQCGPTLRTGQRGRTEKAHRKRSGWRTERKYNACRRSMEGNRVGRVISATPQLRHDSEETSRSHVSSFKDTQQCGNF